MDRLFLNIVLRKYSPEIAGEKSTIPTRNRIKSTRSFIFFSLSLEEHPIFNTIISAEKFLRLIQK